MWKGGVLFNVWCKQKILLREWVLHMLRSRKQVCLYAHCFSSTTLFIFNYSNVSFTLWIVETLGSDTWFSLDFLIHIFLYIYRSSATRWLNNSLRSLLFSKTWHFRGSWHWQSLCLFKTNMDWCWTCKKTIAFSGPDHCFRVLWEAR